MVLQHVRASGVLLLETGAPATGVGSQLTEATGLVEVPIERVHAAPLHSCKYRWLQAPATTLSKFLSVFAQFRVVAGAFPECLRRKKPTSTKIRPKCHFVIDIGIVNPATRLPP